MLKNAVFGNYKTTTFGLLGAILQTVAGGGTWKSGLMSLPMLFLGMFAKDSTTGSMAGGK